MKKILELLKVKVGDIIKKYPVTMFTTLLLTILLCFLVDSDYYGNEFIEKITQFLMFFDFGVLFSETYFNKKNSIISLIVFFIISFGLVLLVNSSYKVWTFKIVPSYLIIISTVIIYIFYKKSKKDFAEYFIKVFSNLVKTGIIYSILSLGLLLLTLAFNYLILGDGYSDLVIRIQILLIGLFLIPSLIQDFSNTTGVVSNFVKVLVHYVLEALVIVAFVIIYLYIFKILITLKMPHNEVFRILAFLFIFACPTWIMNEYYKDKFSKINYYLPLAFVPFIILEIIALAIRIDNNGITNTRYLGIIFIIFQIIYIIIYYLKKKQELNFYSVIILTIVTFLLPVVNILSVSNYSQAKIIKKYINQDTITNLEKNKIRSSYRYLVSNLDNEYYINKYLKNDLAKIKLIAEEYDIDNDNKILNISSSIRINDINIEEYRKLYILQESAFRNNVLINYNDEKIDITNELNNYYHNYDANNFRDYFKEHNIIYINNLKIILSNIELEYTNEELSYYSISGYILEK